MFGRFIVKDYILNSSYYRNSDWKKSEYKTNKLRFKWVKFDWCYKFYDLRISLSAYCLPHKVIKFYKLSKR
jgi:hypothetical protein